MRCVSHGYSQVVSLARRTHREFGGGKQNVKTKTLERVPSCVALVAAVVVIALSIMGDPLGWRERLVDPCTCLMAPTFVGVALLLWPIGESEKSIHN